VLLDSFEKQFDLPAPLDLFLMVFCIYDAIRWCQAQFTCTQLARAPSIAAMHYGAEGLGNPRLM